MSNYKPPEGWLTTDEVAALTNRSMQTILTAIRDGRVKAKKCLVRRHTTSKLGKPFRGRRFCWMMEPESAKAWSAGAKRKGVRRPPPPRKARPHYERYSRSQEAIDLMKIDGVRLPVAADRLRLKPKSVARHLQRQLRTGAITPAEYRQLRNAER